MPGICFYYRHRICRPSLGRCLLRLRFLRCFGLDPLDLGAQFAIFLFERIEALEDRVTGVVHPHLQRTCSDKQCDDTNTG
jgi:hypothetical protein